MDTFFSRTIRSMRLLCMLLALATVACQDSPEVAQLASDKEISSLKLRTLTDTTSIKDITVSFRNDTIHVNAHAKFDLTKLVPEFFIKGKTISPATGVKQDFSKPVTYTVTAEDGSQRQYVVVMKNNKTVFIGAGNQQGAFYALDALYGTPAWMFTGGGGFEYSDPVVYQGAVYAGSIDQHYYAFDAKTGNVKWKFLTGGAIEGAAAIAEGTVYFGSTDHFFYALDAETGALKWKHDLGANVSTRPVVANGNVYVAQYGGELYALNALTGEAKWTYSSSATVIFSGVALSKDVLFIGNGAGHLHAVHAATGTLKWTWSAGGIALQHSEPVVDEGVIYMSGWYTVPDFAQKGSVYAIDEETGKPVWEKHAFGFSSGPVIHKDALYISADDGNFYSLNKGNGEVRWKMPILPNGAQAAVANEIVYVGGGGSHNIYAYSTDGVVKWTFAIEALGTSRPAIN